MFCISFFLFQPFENVLNVNSNAGLRRGIKSTKKQKRREKFSMTLADKENCDII
jgi:hypothetical protein